MYNLSSVKMAQIELSSRCNASCPACSRNISGGPLAPGLVPEDLSLEDIKGMFDLEILKNMRVINYCGNLGDPGINKDLYEIVSYIKENASPNLAQLIRTNGGMRKPEFWTKLGDFFPRTNIPFHPFDHSGVVFSVDGLSDTNHIYRRGVMWDKVWANMQAYSLAGGYGIWEFLIFDHNKHQVDKAKQLAEELNFTFILKYPVGFGETDGVKRPLHAIDRNGNYEYSIWPYNWEGVKIEPTLLPRYSPATWKKVELTEYSQNLSRDAIIKCKSLQHKDSQEIFITASGHLLPCCYIGAALGQKDTTFSRWQFNQKVQEVGFDKFDLRKHSIAEILKDDLFRSFFVKSWEKESAADGKMLFCVEVCGQCSQVDKIYSDDFRAKSFKSS